MIKLALCLLIIAVEAVIIHQYWYHDTQGNHSIITNQIKADVIHYYQEI